jgi:hypothetical protein
LAAVSVTAEGLIIAVGVVAVRRRHVEIDGLLACGVCTALDALVRLTPLDAVNQHCACVVIEARAELCATLLPNAALLLSTILWAVVWVLTHVSLADTITTLGSGGRGFKAARTLSADA